MISSDQDDDDFIDDNFMCISRVTNLNSEQI